MKKQRWVACIAACIIPLGLPAVSIKTPNLPGFPKHLPIPSHVNVMDVLAPGISTIPGVDKTFNVQKVGKNVVQLVWQEAGHTITITTNTDGKLHKKVQDIFGSEVADYTMAWHYNAHDTKEQVDDATDAAKAATNYAKHQVGDTWHDVGAEAEEARRGHIVKAMVDAALNPARNEDRNAFNAAHDSKLIREAMEYAASTYGGPAGAAAYAAWYTYHETGDANKAWRAGLITGVVAQYGGQIAKMPDDTTGRLVSKALAAGAAGGLAVAAQGGSKQDIKDAMMRSAGNVLVQGVSDRAAKLSPGAKDAVVTTQCISARDTACLSHTRLGMAVKNGAQKYVYEATGVTQKNIDDYTGKWTGVDPNSPEGKKLAVIRSLSKLPHSNAIPIDDNRYLLTTTYGTAAPSGKAIPVVLTAVSFINARQKAPPAARPFEWRVDYRQKNGRSGEPAHSDEGPLYLCTIGHERRSITLEVHGHQCEAIYHRGHQPSQVIYHSDMAPGDCQAYIPPFLQDQREKGITCRHR